LVAPRDDSIIDRLPPPGAASGARSEIAMRIALFLPLLALLLGDASAEILHLGGGRSIQGEVVKETPETLFVDIGFTILAVPRKEVLRREQESAEAPAGEERPVESALYRTARRKEMSVKENVERVGAAVVLVSTPGGLGSGFIIHPDGYVVTNDHVVQGERDIAVTIFERTDTGFERRKHANVHIVAMNAYVDLALLKIDGVKDLPTVPLATDDDLTSGQPVFAIGNPLGLERSVSEGIVSTLNRPFEGLTYIQTTTQINPGNSGGPLFDLKGQVVGVTNMTILMAEGLGFAIPVDRVIWFLRNRDAFLFDKDNPNTGFRYLSPPSKKEERAGK
jgi:serine protease Do